MRISTAAAAAAILTLLAPLPAVADQDAVRECGQIADEQERLACYDAFALDPGGQEAGTAPANGESLLHIGVDKHLARNLFDPMSAMSYSVSDIVPCAQIHPKYVGDDKLQDCVCWELNGRNRHGAYTGRKLSHGIVVEMDPAPHFILAAGEVETAEGMQACYDTLQDRPAEKIHEHAR